VPEEIKDRQRDRRFLIAGREDAVANRISQWDRRIVPKESQCGNRRFYFDAIAP